MVSRSKGENASLKYTRHVQPLIETPLTSKRVKNPISSLAKTRWGICSISSSCNSWEIRGNMSQKVRNIGCAGLISHLLHEIDGENKASHFTLHPDKEKSIQ